MSSSPEQARLEARGVALALNLSGGNIADFVVEHDGRALRPLHVAPWVHDGTELPGGLDLVERQLAGDFFCAPFGGAGGPPIHGPTANGRWQFDGTGDAHCARLTLAEPVAGATVTKELRLIDDHPVVYQRHVFNGGAGHLPVAHHAMIRVPGGARLSFSAKAFGVTPNEAPETDPARGRSLLRYPQRFDALNRVAAADGAAFDLSRYPYADRHEDIVVLVESPDTRLAWSAALAAEDGFLFFAMKDPRALPETLLWMSNGGRDYAPWNGRHTAVLGIEEAATAVHVSGGFDSAEGRCDLGHPLGMTLGGGPVEIRYALGAIPAPAGWSSVADITLAEDRLELRDVSGAMVDVPFDGGFFRGG